MILRIFVATCLMSLLLAPGGVLAATDSFTVSFRMSNDTTPPTIPGPVFAVPVATTQIDVNWGASVDNDMLGGYKVFRNGTQIATTTLTSYSDGGLTPSTTYSYYIQAFDDTQNVSTSSVVVSATTLAVPVIPPGGNTSSSGSQSTRVKTLSSTVLIDADTKNVTLSWQTNTYTRFVLRWGRTSAYELGSVQSEVYRQDHLTRITDLEPGTQYVFEIIAYNNAGKPTVIATQSFTTSTVVSGTIPANVSGLSAVGERGGVRLTWQNPSQTGFSRVRIVRNYRFYPNDPADGFIAYEGREESYFDDTAFAQSSLQYYTVFTYDAEGNSSSGAVVAVRAVGTPSTSELLPGSEGTVATHNPAASSTVSTPGVGVTTEASSSLVFDDLQFMQTNQRLLITNGSVTATSTLPLRIVLPYELVPEHLKSILVTLRNDVDGEHTYLLRINKDKTAYEAEIATPQPGTYQLVVSVYDFETKIQEKIAGTLLVVPGNEQFTHSQSASWPLPLPWVGTVFGWWWLIPLVIMCLIRYIVRVR